MLIELIFTYFQAGLGPYLFLLAEGPWRGVNVETWDDTQPWRCVGGSSC
jgi:hypothetical protein